MKRLLLTTLFTLALMPFLACAVTQAVGPDSLICTFRDNVGDKDADPCWTLSGIVTYPETINPSTTAYIDFSRSLSFYDTIPIKGCPVSGACTSSTMWTEGSFDLGAATMLVGIGSTSGGGSVSTPATTGSHDLVIHSTLNATLDPLWCGDYVQFGGSIESPESFTCSIGQSYIVVPVTVTPPTVVKLCFSGPCP